MALSTFRAPSATNVVLPSDVGQIIAWMRKPENFTINKWMQYVPVKTMQFLWMRLSRDASVRVVNTNEMVWPSGASRKSRGNDKATLFAEQTGVCIRRDESGNVPWLENEQSHRWDILATDMRRCASVMMTGRTQLAVNQLITGNWQGNSADANVLNKGRGFWNKASNDPNNPNYQAISQTLVNAVRNIKLITNAEVDYDDLMLLLNPDDAIRIGLTPEVRDLLNHTVLAKNQLEGEVATMKNLYGCPPQIAALPIVVEDSPIVTSVPRADGTEAVIDVDRKFILPSGTAYIIARPGSLDGAPNSTSFSTIQAFHHGGLLELEAYPDSEDRLTRTHASEAIDIELAGALAGYQITNIIG
jgi:hypothetical protein